jgi:hypothetical protein
MRTSEGRRAGMSFGILIRKKMHARKSFSGGLRRRKDSADSIYSPRRGPGMRKYLPAIAGAYTYKVARVQWRAYPDIEIFLETRADEAQVSETSATFLCRLN